MLIMLYNCRNKYKKGVSSMADKWYVTWGDVNEFIKNEANRYKDEKITGVYGIPRGGLVLADRLSRGMDIPMLLAPFHDCIIMDDISDTGESLLHYDRNSSGGGNRKGYHIVTMFYRKGSLVIPEFYQYIKEDKWIVYPWET